MADDAVMIGDVLAHWFNYGGRSQYGALTHHGREPSNACELVAAILERVRAPQSPDGSWCINCFVPFSKLDNTRYCFGLPESEVGPLCQVCHATVNKHARCSKCGGA